MSEIVYSKSIKVKTYSIIEGDHYRYIHTYVEKEIIPKYKWNWKKFKFEKYNKIRYIISQSIPYIDRPYSEAANMSLESYAKEQNFLARIWIKNQNKNE